MYADIHAYIHTYNLQRGDGPHQVCMHACMHHTYIHTSNLQRGGGRYQAKTRFWRSIDGRNSLGRFVPTTTPRTAEEQAAADAERQEVRSQEVGEMDVKNDTCTRRPHFGVGGAQQADRISIYLSMSVRWT